MKLRFASSSEHGLRWMLRYYERVFPAGRKGAAQNYRKAKAQLLQEPYSGHPFRDHDGVFELMIRRSYFSIIYTVEGETIFVIDIRDQRGMRPSVLPR